MTTRKDYMSIAEQQIKKWIQQGMSSKDAHDTALRDAGELYKALRLLKMEQLPVTRSRAIERLKKHIIKKEPWGDRRYTIHEDKCYFPVAYLDPWTRRYLEQTRVIERAGNARELNETGVNVEAFHGRTAFYKVDKTILFGDQS